MDKKNIFQIILIIILIAILCTIVALFIKGNNTQNTGLQNNGMQNLNGGAPPDKPDGNGGMPEGNTNTNVSHTGATEISSDTTDSDTAYSSTTSSENALLVIGGESTISNPTVTKSGNSDGDNSDSYGTNAAVLVKEGTLNITGVTVTTNVSHANGVFS